jgi:hypothetical protein
MFDADLKYCPKCNDEYRLEISVCAACGLELLTGAQMLEQAAGVSAHKSQPMAKIESDDKLISLQKGNLLDMKRVKSLLAEHSIPAVLVKDQQCRSGCCGGVEVIVQIRLEDTERAAVLLQKEYERTTGMEFQGDQTEDSIFNPDAQLAVCPACGHTFPPDGPDCPDCGLCFM